MADPVFIEGKATTAYMEEPGARWFLARAKTRDGTKIAQFLEVPQLRDRPFGARLPKARDGRVGEAFPIPAPGRGLLSTNQPVSGERAPFGLGKSLAVDLPWSD
eukprot:gene5089-6359_t